MRKKWLRCILAGTLAVSLSLSLLACGSGNESSESGGASSGTEEKETEEDAAKEDSTTEDAAQEETSGNEEQTSGEKITLKFWDMVWGGAEYAAEAEKLAHRYTEEHPNVEIEYQSIPWQNRYETFSVAIASGEGPDVSTGGGYQQHQFAASDDILPLNDIIDEWEAEGKLDDFLEGTVEFFQDFEGNQLGIPFNIDPRGIIYRKDIFEEHNLEIPKTWDELYDVATTLTDPDQGFYGMVYAASDSNANVTFMSMLLANNGGVWTEDGTTPDWEKPQNLETLDFVAKLRDAGVFPEGMASYEVTDAERLFLQGNAAMIVDSVGLGTQIKDIGDEFAANCALMPMPMGPSAEEPMMATALNAYMVYSGTKHPDEAKDFVKWWSENNLELWTGAAACGSPPIRHSFLEDPSYVGMEQNPYIQEMIDLWVPAMKSTMYPAAQANLVQNTLDAERWWRDISQAVLVGEKTNEEILAEKQAAAEELVDDIGL